MSTQIFIQPNVNNFLSKIFTQTADSPPATDTVERTLIGTGIGSLAIPANGFSVGDSFSVTMGGHISSANNQDLRIRVLSGLVILGDTGIITMPATTNKHWSLEIRFTIRAIGSAGVAAIASFGQFTYSKNASNAYEGSDFSIINNTTFDTTVLNSLKILASWGTINPSNSIYSEICTLYKTH
jgi:hypothetical protein